MSQIPGINGCQDGKPPGQNRPYYKDTDSKYVRLAKQGGRRDLLNYQEFDQHKEAVAYPRVDWYYLEDNALADAKKKKEQNWQFGVPEYMTQGPPHRQESGDQIDGPQKLEASQNGQTNMAALNGLHTEKDVPIRTMAAGLQPAEIHSKTTLGSPCMTTDCGQNDPVACSPNYKFELVRGVAPDQEFKNPITQKDYVNSSPAGLVRNQGNKRNNNSISMSKLLSHSYGKEWHDQLKDQQLSARRLHYQVAQEVPPSDASLESPTNSCADSGDKKNDEIRFTNDGRPMNETEMSRTFANMDITDSGQANNAVRQQRLDDRKMTA